MVKIRYIKKNSLLLLPFYMVVATYLYYEKVRRTTRTAIVSNLLKWEKSVCKRVLLFLFFRNTSLSDSWLNTKYISGSSIT